jgi:flagellin FlaB
MQKKNMNEENNDWGSIGIGAMIVFIALILVAAVASAVIIQTGEKLQQNAQQSGSDTQQEISGKISIITVWVGAQTAAAEEITMVFELAPGSEPIADDAVHWAVICDDGAGTPAVVDGDLSTATNLDTSAIANNVFLPGETYMIDLVVGGAAGATCAPALNEEHSMVISANGGGSTYETLYYQSTTQGDQVV